jgi:hypothetical protein
MMLGYILVDGVEERMDVRGALRVASELELASRIHSDEHDSGEHGQYADDDEHFYEGETVPRVSFHKR